MVDTVELTELKAAMTELTITVATLAKSHEELNNNATALELTLRHLDDNVNKIKVNMANKELNQYKEMQKLINETIKPVTDSIHKIQKEAAAFALHAEVEHSKIKVDVTRDLIDRIKLWAKILGFGLAVACVIAGVYLDVLLREFHEIQTIVEKLPK